jgi:proteasome accessory factor B
MSKSGYIERYKLILQKLRKQTYCSYEELEQHIFDRLQFAHLRDERVKTHFSKRTFQRDIAEINQLFGIQIAFSRQQKAYYIEQSHYTDIAFTRMIEAYDTFNTFNITDSFENILVFENRRSKGLENLEDVISAIKSHSIVEFDYEKFNSLSNESRRLHPYFLKEYKYRWYIIGLDEKDKKVKSFALDRINYLTVTNQKFKPADVPSIMQRYEHCFGIFCPDKGQPQNVVLSFPAHQAPYFKTLPLHHSQDIIIDNDKEFRMAVTVFITPDFIMELLSFAQFLKVIEPLSLKQTLIDTIKKATKTI